MDSIASTTPPTKAMTIALWILKIALGLIFLAAAGAKLVGVPALVAEFDQVGLGQWFRYVTALIELSGALLLLMPRTAFYGAGVLTLVCVGALVAQVTAIHQDWIHCVVMGALLLFIAVKSRRDASGMGSR